MLPTSSAEHYRQQQQIDALTAASVRRAWTRMGDDFDASWARIRTQILNLVTAGQLAAARTSAGYVTAVLAETGQDAGEPEGTLVPEAFTGYASDGRALGTLLDEAPIQAKAAVSAGKPISEALTAGQSFLTMVTLTQIADVSRQVVSADITRHPKQLGYVRMLNPPSCSRCIILAGKWFRWNEGFRRHPNCDCRHIPSLENRADDFRTDPYQYFQSLTPEQRSATFGRIEARAITDGADIYRVVNVGQRGLGVAGSKQAIRYGTPTRMTVDEIYRTAGTRTNAVKLMREHGYITGEQVAGGNIIGQREGFGQLGKGGRARAATDAVTAARATGVRNPLDRYTMTAAERRLYDAKTRLDAAEQRGIWLRSIGANSADRNTTALPITKTRLEILRRAYATELGRARTGPASVKRLATALGITL